MPILTTAGVLQGDLISDTARAAFLSDTITLMRTGTAGFMFGMIPAALTFGASKFIADSFDVGALAAHQATYPMWHRIFIDQMFQRTAIALDIDGSTPLAPIMDFTVPFARFGFTPKQLDVMQFAAGMTLVDPTFQTQLSYFFDVDVSVFTPSFLVELLTSIPPPSVPGIPNVPLPFDASILTFDVPAGLPAVSLPQLIVPPNPPLEFPSPLPTPVIGFDMCVVVKAIPIVFASLLVRALGGELITALSRGPVGLVGFAASIVFDAVSSCFGIEMRSAPSFLAGFLVFVERLVAMLLTVVVGVVFGEGLLVGVVASTLGLT